MIALGLYHGAFMAEVFRAGFIRFIEDNGSAALGLSFPQMFGSVICRRHSASSFRP